MTVLASNTTAILSWATFLAQIVIVCAAIVLAAVILKHPNARLHHLAKKAADHAFLIGLLVSLVSLVASLFLFEYYRFCSLRALLVAENLSLSASDSFRGGVLQRKS